ncbi:hypothetical protein JAAARDRAFT_49897 [Jaapia argillacea MUCL 33604]|uniref:Uncharacterized protein n=1 Tax=Jaapia argillacea MUCL 33604 TaxID=933084 RepID=A0A067PH24_9AGAM|nr:hypothetical protein JAAARDRAFT_49897 [Jaapia argillacea MUCL 33604]
MADWSLLASVFIRDWLTGVYLHLSFISNQLTGVCLLLSFISINESSVANDFYFMALTGVYLLLSFISYQLTGVSLLLSFISWCSQLTEVWLLLSFISGQLNGVWLLLSFIRRGDWSLLASVFHQLPADWSLNASVFHQKPADWSLLACIFHQSPVDWSPLASVFHQGWLADWSLNASVFHQAPSEWSLLVSIFHQQVVAMEQTIGSLAMLQPTFRMLGSVSSNLFYLQCVAAILLIVEHSFWFSGKGFIDKFAKAVKKYNSSGYVTYVRQLVENSYTEVDVFQMDKKAKEKWLYLLIVDNLMLLYYLGSGFLLFIFVCSIALNTSTQ